MSADKHEFTFSTGRKAVIQELNGLEQFQADKACKTSEMLPVMYMRAAASIVSLDGEEFLREFDVISLSGRLQKLKATEMDQLLGEYNTAFTNFSAEDLKNS